MGGGEHLRVWLGGHRDCKGPGLPNPGAAKPEGCWISPADAGDALPWGSGRMRAVCRKDGKQGATG